MTDDVVDAMARAIHDANPGVYEPWANIIAAEALGNRLAERTAALRRAEARAAIRAVHERGGLVVARMPEDATPETVQWRYGDSWEDIQDGTDEETLAAICDGYADGHNAALAAVRAAAVEAE